MTDLSSITPAQLIARPLDVVQARLAQLPAERLNKDGDDWDVPALFISKLQLAASNGGLIKQVCFVLLFTFHFFVAFPDVFPFVFCYVADTVPK